MTVFNRMLNTQALLFFYILAGIIVRKVGIITPAVRENFNLFLIRITLPMMILSSFLGNVSLEQLQGSGMIILISAAGCGFAWLIGKALWSKREWAQRGPLIFGVTFSNAANAGMPVSQLVFGDVGVFLASIYLLPMRILIWTLGLSFFVRDNKKKMVKELLLNPCISMVFLGLIIMLTQVRLPMVLVTAIDHIGDMTGPLSMILIGTTLAEFKFNQVISLDVILVTALRLVILPLIMLIVLKLLRVDELITQVAVTLNAMPVATTTVVLAERYKADYHLGAISVLLSTLLSLLTVPLITLLF